MASLAPLSPTSAWPAPVIVAGVCLDQLRFGELGGDWAQYASIQSLDECRARISSFCLLSLLHGHISINMLRMLSYKMAKLETKCRSLE